MKLVAIIFPLVCLWFGTAYGQQESDETVAAPIVDSPTPEILSEEENSPTPPSEPIVAPLPYSSFQIIGKTRHPVDELQSIFAPTVKRFASLSPGSRQPIEKLADDLGYHVDALNVFSGTLTITLEPKLSVRYIDVKIKGQSFLRFWKVNELLFQEEILRRMRLREASPLPYSSSEIASVLRQEETRIATYLRSVGFGSARVEVQLEKLPNYTARLVVVVWKGPLYYLGRVTVEGNKAVSAEAIVKKLRHQRCVVRICAGRQPFSIRQLREDMGAITKLYQERGFPAIQVATTFDPETSFQHDKRTVEFRVLISERRQLDVEFLGGSERVPESKIREVLTFNSERSYDNVEADASAAAIRRLFQENGYFEATVLWRRQRLGGRERAIDRIVFEINPGPNLRVDEVTVTGNKVISSSKIIESLRTREYSAFPVFATGGYTGGGRLQEDVLIIRSLYLERGYAQTKVQVDVGRRPQAEETAATLGLLVASDSDGSRLTVRFHIDEGPMTKVATIDIDGVDPKEKQEIRDLLRVTPGAPYVKTKLEQDVARISTYLGNSGFPYARVRSEPTTTGNSVSLLYSIEKGQRVIYGTMLPRGNFKTRSWVIRGEANLQKGEVFSQQDMDRANRRLQETGLFRSVDIRHLDANASSQDEAGYVINVQEAHDYWASFEFGAGYTSDLDALFAEGKMTQPNIGGYGIHHVSRLQTALGESVIDIDKLFLAETRWKSPNWIGNRLLGFRFETDVRASLRREREDRFGLLTSYGGTLTFSRSGKYGFFEGWRIALEYTFRHWNREEELVRAAGASDDIQLNPIVTRTGSIGGRLVVDKRVDGTGKRNSTSPTGGFKMEFRGLFADPYLLSTSRFVKIGFSGQHFIGFKKRFLITNQLRLDQGIPLDNIVVLPVVERFFAGGDNTVRGFEEDRLKTEVIIEDFVPTSEYQRIRIRPSGGNIRGLYNLDFQIGIRKLGAADFSTGLFYDLGFISNSFQHLKLDDLRHSTGISARIGLSSLLSISVDWAIPLNPRIGDTPTGRLHIRAGLMF